jgi:hypothetical protein
MPNTLTVWDVELTDTFGGEANYSWVRRDQLVLPQDASRRQIVTAAKAALGLTGATADRTARPSCRAFLRVDTLH